ncbi:hypothetical protein VP01_1754g1 [Puccinia sorghi]|uniref:Uncharacterized protein n=1 Tax=Puccinia sorghi TaxID=27349 RepID=A0A0L6VF49_9BASI|nr:hypothetical protein VP01_1754g1 [Puccinia sorghi]
MMLLMGWCTRKAERAKVNKGKYLQGFWCLADYPFAFLSERSMFWVVAKMMQHKNGLFGRALQGQTGQWRARGSRGCAVGGLRSEVDAGAVLQGVEIGGDLGVWEINGEGHLTQRKRKEEWEHSQFFSELQCAHGGNKGVFVFGITQYTTEEDSQLPTELVFLSTQCLDLEQQLPPGFLMVIRPRALMSSWKLVRKLPNLTASCFQVIDPVLIIRHTLIASLSKRLQFFIFTRNFRDKLNFFLSKFFFHSCTIHELRYNFVVCLTYSRLNMNLVIIFSLRPETKITCHHHLLVGHPSCLSVKVLFYFSPQWLIKFWQITRGSFLIKNITADNSLKSTGKLNTTGPICGHQAQFIMNKETE